LDILELLNKTKPRSEHVIELIRSIHSPSESWIILPKLQPISWFDLFSSEQALRFSRHLIAGLEHIHRHKIAHLDVKPGNLALKRIEQKLNLVIFDFDTAIKLKNDDQVVVGYRGTENWTAPEVGLPDGEDKSFKPIPADLWACGRVIEFFFRNEETQPLRELTERLVAVDPDERPSMEKCLVSISMLDDRKVSL
jgi:serine/threonine protein kinase